MVEDSPYPDWTRGVWIDLSGTVHYWHRFSLTTPCGIGILPVFHPEVIDGGFTDCGPCLAAAKRDLAADIDFSLDQN